MISNTRVGEDIAYIYENYTYQRHLVRPLDLIQNCSINNLSLVKEIKHVYITQDK
jgi:hypothetical protein